MEYTPFAQLEVGQKGCKIRCRVARMWDSTNPTMNDELMSVDFLLVDEQYSAIQGSIKKEDAPHFKDLLTEGKVYIIANFTVAAARKSYRVCEQKNMIRVGTWTIIKEICDADLPIPTNSFNLVNDKHLESRLYNDIQLTDIIGHITSVERLSIAYANGRDVYKKNLAIQTLNIQYLPITLWGNVAQAFNEEDVLSLKKTEPVVAILTSMTVRAFKGQATLSSTSATKIYINPEIEAATKFRTSLTYPNEVPSISESLQPTTNPADHFQHNQKTIIELLQLDRISDMGKKYACTGTIAQIDAERGWWYNACPKCKAGINGYEEVPSCRKCGPITNLPLPWYKLEATIADDTGEAKFLIFGKHVERLVKISAIQLSDLPDSKRTVLPPIIQQMCGKTCTLIVSINERDKNVEALKFNVSYIAEKATEAPKNVPTPYQQKRKRNDIGEEPGKPNT